MKISMSMIADYLLQRGYRTESHILKDTMTISGVRFFTDQLPSPSLDYVYLGQARAYFQDPRYEKSLLLSNGKNQILCDGADYEELLNDVLSSFDYYNHLEQELFLAGSRHEPLEKIMEIAGEVMEDPFLIFDLEGGLAAAVNAERLEDPELIENLRRNQTLGDNILGRTFVDSQGRVSHDLTDRPQYLHTKGRTDNGALAMYLQEGKERVGFVLLFPLEVKNVPARMCILPLFTAACVQAAQFADKTSVRQGSHSIFLKLLQGETLLPAVLRKFEERQHFSANLVLLVFQNMAIRNYTLRYMLMQEIEQLPGKPVMSVSQKVGSEAAGYGAAGSEAAGYGAVGSGMLSENAARKAAIACEFEDRVVVLTDEHHQKDITARIRKSISGENLAIGISMPFQPPEQIRNAYEQAVFALNYSQESGVRSCRDLALPYLLQSLQEQEMTRKLVHPAFGLLEEYDQHSHTDLERTLREYLAAGCSQADTAARMHIHLNTLKYRLQRICEITGANFKDQEEVFYLQLSSRILPNM